MRATLRPHAASESSPGQRSSAVAAVDDQPPAAAVIPDAREQVARAVRADRRNGAETGPAPVLDRDRRARTTRRAHEAEDTRPAAHTLHVNRERIGGESGF